MLLSDRDIRDARKAGALEITPWEDELLQPSSVDVRLGRVFRFMVEPTAGFIDCRQSQPELFQMVKPAKGEPFMLMPGEFALASTFEEIGLGARLAARLEGKSSLGRLGYRVHSTAGFIDPGFHGQVTLELSNDTPYPQAWWPGMKVGQLCIFQLTSPAERPYGHAGNRYQGQVGPTRSMSWHDWRDWSDEVYATPLV